MDKQESGGVHDIRKRGKEMEVADVSFLGLQPSAMKMEKMFNPFNASCSKLLLFKAFSAILV